MQQLVIKPWSRRYASASTHGCDDYYENEGHGKSETIQTNSVDNNAGSKGKRGS